jgi:hypothetical protein
MDVFYNLKGQRIARVSLIPDAAGESVQVEATPFNKDGDGAVE